MMRRMLLATAVAVAILAPFSASAVSAAPAIPAVQGCALQVYYCNWEYYSTPAHLPPVVGYFTVLCDGMTQSSGHGTAYYIFTESKCPQLPERK